MSTTEAPVTREDLEASLRGIETSLKGEVQARKKPVVAGAVLAMVVVLLVVFFLGRRAGKKKSTVVEIRRL